MRIANQLIRATIPGGIFLSVWIAWLLANQEAGICCSFSSLRSFLNVDLGSGGILVALTGLALLAGWLIAQIYWALYWTPVLRFFLWSLLTAPLARVPWPGMISGRRIFSIDESDILRQVGCDRQENDRLQAAIVVDTAIYLRTQGLKPDADWQNARDRITTIYDAYHAHGTAALAILLAWLTIALYECLVRWDSLGRWNWIVLWTSLFVIIFLLVARDHAGVQAQRYSIEFLREV